MEVSGVSSWGMLNMSSQILTLGSFSGLCLTSEGQCFTASDSAALGAVLLTVGVLPHLVMLLCMPRCTPFSSRPPKAVYNEWLTVASTPIGAAILCNEPKQVAMLAQVLRTPSPLCHLSLCCAISDDAAVLGTM